MKNIRKLWPLALVIVLTFLLFTLIIVLLNAILHIAQNNGFKFASPSLMWWGIDLIATVVAGLYEAYLMYFKKSRSKTKLASSQWLAKKEFHELFKSYNFSKDVIKHGFLLESKISGNDFTVRPTKDIGHALVVGATRSGKTSRLVNPNIQTLARAKDKASMIISDPKGELYDFHSQALHDLGYEVLSINLRDHNASSQWNPLEIIWHKWKQEDLSPLELEMSRDEAKGSLSELATVMFPEPTRGEAIWSQGANTVFQFMVLAMLELSDYDEKITLDTFNIHNVLVNLNSATYQDLFELATVLDTLAKKQKTISHALAVGGRNIRGAETTVNGMVQNAVSMLKVYNDSKVKRIISSTNIKLDDTKPQAIFLIVPDEEKSKNGFISLFVAETYKELIHMANANKDHKLMRPLYYILDEFGNIPKIPNLDSMVTVSASRNVFFMFILQNYKQINESYGPNIASIIMGNCGYEFYLLTNDHETAEAFSKKMGDREIQKVSKSSSKNDKGFSSSTSVSDQTRRLIHADELMKLKEGEIIVSAQRLNPIKSSLAPFWEFQGFKPGKLERNKNKTIESFDLKHVYNFVTPTSDDKELEQNQEVQMTGEEVSNDESENDDELVSQLQGGN